MKSRPLCALLGATTALVLTGCTSAAGGGAQPSPPALGAIPTVTDPSQISLPTDAYQVTTEQIRQLSKAADLVTADCMRTFGFPHTPTDLGDLDGSARGRFARTVLYGAFDPATAGTKAYNAWITVAAPQPGSALAPAHHATTEELTALMGTDPASGRAATEVNGLPLPPGGCDRKGLDTIGGALPAVGDAELPEGGPKTSQSDPRVVAAYAKWSDCMRGMGYGYHDPAAAMLDPRWPRTTTSAEEIATATADLRCKLANNTVGVLVAVERAYDQRYIDSHESALAAYRQRYEDLARNAARLITG